MKRGAERAIGPIASEIDLVRLGGRVLHRRWRPAGGPLAIERPRLKVSILATGGAGFVATTLIGRLLARGETVMAVYNMSRGSAANLEALQRNPGLI